MVRLIHLERRFEKELEALWKRGEKGAIAAQKAEELIEGLTRNGPPHLKKIWKMTGWGEKRIEGCLKYDLGDGYRAVCFRRGDILFLSFVGDHDESQKYLDHYSGRHNWVGKENGTTLPVQLAVPSEGPAAAPSDEDSEDDYDEYLLEQIDDKTLRKIFSGLVKNGKQPDQSV
jgi:hypothetical protein